MSKTWKTFTTKFKAKMALKEQETLAEIGSWYGVHPVVVGQWKKQPREGLPQIFADRRVPTGHGEEELRNQLCQHIGQLKVELVWLERSWLGLLRRSGR